MQDAGEKVKDVSMTAMRAGAKAMATLGHAKFDNASLFSTDIAKLEQLRNSLEGNSDRDKLEAMRRLIGMMSQGTDVSGAFPSVVKNVVSTNTELKKLVHMFLVHYADVEPEVILLSINTFQKDMRGPNQLIRASALRVMSSIRVKVITQPVVLAIKSAVIDSSPYVRKAACTALLKVYSVDPELKEELIEILTNLLKDGSTMVLGSAIQVFKELCPDRTDLLHGVYRKLCHLIADMDEWGQIAALDVLLRYARGQFLDPSPEAVDARQRKANAEEGNDDDAEPEEEEPEDELRFGDEGELDPDHQLLLKSTSPLLQSRSAAVVFGVVALYVAVAPERELRPVGKALCRVLRSSREAQWLALINCATLATQHPDMLRPHLAEFFVSNDTPTAASLKLEILTFLVDEGNISKVLRELSSYVKHESTPFVRATVQAIGRCAIGIPAVMDSCIHSLMRLLSNRSEVVVAEAVIVLKRLLQTPAAADNDNVIRQLARLLDTITVPTARAAITWLCGEYNARIEAYAPDVLRKLAKSFALEDPAVKLQIINLGAKLFVVKPDAIRQLFEYVLTLAKYDQAYDVRDRSRMLRILLLSDKAPTLAAAQKRLLCTSKPVPVARSAYAERARWALGTITHTLNQEVDGYEPLPDFPSEQPDKSVRDIEYEVSNIGQSLSSDVGLGSSSYTPGGTGSQLANPSVLSGGDDDFYGDDIEGFYDDEEYYDEGGYYDENGEWVDEGDEGGYYDDDGNWVDESGEGYDEYGEEGYDEYGEGYDEYEEGWDEGGYAEAAADDAYLLASGDLPPLSGLDKFAPEDDTAEAFFSS